MQKTQMIESYKQILKNRHTMLIESTTTSEPEFKVGESDGKVHISMYLDGNPIDTISFSQLNG